VLYSVDYLLILITVQSILGNVESIGQKKVCDMAAKVDALCPGCGSDQIGTRTSRKAENTIVSECYCKSCGRVHFELWTEIRNISIGTFTPALIQNFKTAEQWAKERQMRKQGKLPAIDERQIEIPTD